MKPREDGEGVAMNKTSKDLSYPNMTQDEPERVKEIQGRLVGLKSADTAGAARFYTYAPADISLLLSLLSVSEKRAETAEQLAEDWQCEYDKVLEERDAERTESARAFATAAAALRERDEARAVSDSLAENLHELQADHVTCQSERDEARGWVCLMELERDSLRSSLMRVSGEREKFWLIVNIARDLINGPPGPHVSVDEAGSWDVIVREQMAKALSALQASGDG